MITWLPMRLVWTVPLSYTLMVIEGKQGSDGIFCEKENETAQGRVVTKFYSGKGAGTLNPIFHFIAP